MMMNDGDDDDDYFDCDLVVVDENGVDLSLLVIRANEFVVEMKRKHLLMAVVVVVLEMIDHCYLYYYYMEMVMMRMLKRQAFVRLMDPRTKQRRLLQPQQQRPLPNIHFDSRRY